ncbi:MAG: aldehyde dehydrogenase family protein [Candidatus Omnitrophica bacterium]|nr:aldehyde dehydrogenase family protein [Candidatus Omnitrophota bacterium]
MQEYKYYVGGQFRESKDKIDIINPATGEKFARIFEAAEDDLNFAVKSARIAGREWKKVSFKERAVGLREIGKVMFDNLRELAQVETREIGKTLKESLFVDVPLGAECFNYYASFLEGLEEKSLESELGIDLVKYEPFGVAGIYLPYNVPLMIFGFSCAAALAAGNAVVIKPSEYGALSILELAKYIDKLDLPKGLINIVTGGGATVGKQLASADLDIISFTGSMKTLKKVAAVSSQNPKKMVCELGGANAAVIFSDAHRESATQNVLAAAFMKQGQMCIGSSIILIEENIYDEFVKDFVERVKKIKVGDPFSPETGVGPLPTKKHVEEVNDQVVKLQKKGAKVLCGANPDGYFYPPTVLECQDFPVEEFFAPVVAVKKFKNRKEVEAIVEDQSGGLVLQIWTQDIGMAKSLADRARCGTVWINSFAQMNAQTPFGGVGSSGWGRSLGKLGFFEYIQPKHIGIGFKQSPVFGWFGV